jgi:hypothetical protein
MNSTRQAVFESIRRVREGIDQHRHLPFARHALRIPEGDYYALMRLYPGLASSDPQERAAAMEHFERTPFAEAYRVGKIHRGVIKNGLIIK